MRRLVKQLRHGQITIPKEFRDELGLGPGDRLSVTLEDGKLVLERVQLTMTMGSPWLKALYDHHVSALEPAPEQEIDPTIDGANKKTRARRKRR